MMTGRVLLALLLGGMVVGCADRPLPTDVPDPAFDFTNNMDNANPMIDRFVGRTPFTVNDAETGMFALMSSAKWDYGCFAPVPYFVYHIQDIQHDPANVRDARVNRLIKAWNVHISVFAGSGPGDYTSCAQLAAAKLADGWGTMTLTDNDVYADGAGGQGTNSTGLIARGKVGLTGGGETHVTVVSRCQWDTEDWATWRCPVNKVQIN